MNNKHNNDGYVKNLKDFIDEAEKDCKNLKNDLNSISGNFLDKSLTCPYNFGHRNISKSNYEKHVRKCSLLNKIISLKKSYILYAYLIFLFLTFYQMFIKFLRKK
jgi:hypothetical protein